MKFSVKDFFSKCDHKKSLMENFMFCAVSIQIPLKYNFSAALRKSTPDVFEIFLKRQILQTRILSRIDYFIQIVSLMDSMCTTIFKTRIYQIFWVFKTRSP